MTEIPEHLLKRSRAAKGKGDEGASSDSTAVTPAAAAASAAPAAAGPPAVAAAAAAIPADKPAPAPAPEPHYIEAAKARRRIPAWVLPLVGALPIWAIAFAGTMQQPEVEDPLFTGAEAIYAEAGCAGCHGGGGGGGVGYQLSDGNVWETFPDPVDQMVHIVRGSSAINGEAYGAERSDGQRVAGASGNNMPAFGELTMLELELVVFHERAVLSGEDTSSAAYQEWMEHLRELEEEGDETPVDFDLLLACANPDYTPGATGVGAPDEDHPCPGPHAEGEEVAAG